ncbi:ABC transporter permease [Pandoraea communis]|uniref:ABC transporter permease n=2 Tax=Pandoraea communis TaxID=2508297 RepID=A0A5E4WB11_9BURK|nr:EamA family transporter [Pandoraea communis]MDM8359042.1 EamA family transporter [Pandoraea communis]VVE22197.1 ABC transporter permease [Pandoraea communis]
MAMTTTTSPLPIRWADALLTALAPMIWGSTYIVTTQLLPPDRPFTAALIRVLPSGLLLLLYARRWPARRDWGRLVVLSALNIGAFQALLFVAAYRLPGGLAAVVGAIQPLLVMGLAWGVEHRRPLATTAWAALAGVAGMGVLLLSPGTVFEPVGILAALAGAASMAMGTYLTRRWRLDMPVLALTGWQLLLGGLMLVPVAWLADAPLPALTMWQTLGYLYLSIAGALLAYALWFRGIARLAPVAVSSLGLLSPLTAVVLGWVLLGQAIKGVAFVGLAMVFASILAVQWTASRS